VAALSPLAHPLADPVDEGRLLEPAVGPLGAEGELRPFLRGCGMGTKYPLSLRFSMMSFVMPSSSNRKWRVGSR